jgi:hypothetical protein
VSAFSIVNRVMADLAGRAGIFDGVDEDVLDEIRAELEAMVADELGEPVQEEPEGQTTPRRLTRYERLQLAADAGQDTREDRRGER